MDVSPLNLGMIAAYYNINRADFEAPHFKTFLLLQAHFSRLQLPPDLSADQALVLEKVMNLLSACVDVMSSNAWLNAFGVMDLSQMCAQSMRETDSPLKQIPHFETDVIKRCKDAGVESVYDVMEMEDDQRNALLQMDARPMRDRCKSFPFSRTQICFTDFRISRRDVAAFVNSYPTLDVTHELVKDEFTAGAPVVFQVALSRDADEDDKDAGDATVVAPYFPVKKLANWWVVIGELSIKQLLSIKRVTVAKSLPAKLEFTLPKGTHNLKLYVICDSYIGADHDIPLEAIEVAEGEDRDSDDYDSADDAMEE